MEYINSCFNWRETLVKFLICSLRVQSAPCNLNICTNSTWTTCRALCRRPKCCSAPSRSSCSCAPRTSRVSCRVPYSAPRTRSSEPTPATDRCPTSSCTCSASRRPPSATTRALSTPTSTCRSRGSCPLHPLLPAPPPPPSTGRALRRRSGCLCCDRPHTRSPPSRPARIPPHEHVHSSASRRAAAHSPLRQTALCSPCGHRRPRTQRRQARRLRRSPRRRRSSCLKPRCASRSSSWVATSPQNPNGSALHSRQSTGYRTRVTRTFLPPSAPFLAILHTQNSIPTCPTFRILHPTTWPHSASNTLIKSFGYEAV